MRLADTYFVPTILDVRDTRMSKATRSARDTTVNKTCSLPLMEFIIHWKEKTKNIYLKFANILLFRCYKVNQ